jgi:hypothetical protein
MHRFSMITDEVSALARKVILKFDFLLALPVVMTLYQCQY